jgi:hypothetical protein
MTSPFWNRREAGLRAGWRVALFILATGIVSTVLSGPGRRFLAGLLPVVYANVRSVWAPHLAAGMSLPQYSPTVIAVVAGIPARTREGGR